VYSFLGLLRPCKTVYIWPRGKGFLDAIRNGLVEQAMTAGCTHLFMGDTDQVYPNDTLVRLLSHRLSVVAGKVHRGSPPYDPILYRGENYQYELVSDDEWRDGQLVEVDAIGCGAVLYDMRCFMDIPPPWFEFTRDDDGTPVGEDIAFCHKLRQAGYLIHVDCSVKVGHLRNNVITEESYFAYNEGAEYLKRLQP
jgi:hypothetical protein